MATKLSPFQKEVLDSIRRGNEYSEQVIFDLRRAGNRSKSLETNVSRARAALLEAGKIRISLAAKMEVL